MNDPEYRLSLELAASARAHSLELTIAAGAALKRVAASHDAWALERRLGPTGCAWLLKSRQQFYQDFARLHQLSALRQQLAGLNQLGI